MIDEILSTLYIKPTSYFVYSALSAFADRGLGELPGPWFVAALKPYGHSPAAIRQTLFRMSREKELNVRKDGRTNYYKATPFSLAEARVGADKIFAQPSPKWDEAWTLVQYSFPDEKRIDRDRLRNLLEVMGFAPLGHGVHIHPKDYRRAIRDAIADNDLSGNINVFRGKRDATDNKKEFTSNLWALDEINSFYRVFLETFQPLENTKLRLSDEDAFGLRFALVFEFLEAAWKDPELPIELLPQGWLGGKAQTLAARLYKRYMPQARLYANALVNHEATSSREVRTV